MQPFLCLGRSGFLFSVLMLIAVYCAGTRCSLVCSWGCFVGGGLRCDLVLHSVCCVLSLYIVVVVLMFLMCCWAVPVFSRSFLVHSQLCFSPLPYLLPPQLTSPRLFVSHLPSLPTPSSPSPHFVLRIFPSVFSSAPNITSPFSPTPQRVL